MASEFCPVCDIQDCQVACPTRAVEILRMLVDGFDGQGSLGNDIELEESVERARELLEELGA